ncbi:hypothetical protein C8R46DRAFT_289430 [Mycena filopes]|nr:hypothetical protein C8R46DRAFT_289430 [Mycena filopes]
MDSSSRFPPEILGIIIQNLGAAKDTLKDVGSVSRACLFESRRILHRSVSVSADRRAGFLDLISSPHNTYTSVLEAIKIGLDREAPAASTSRDQEPTPALFQRLLDFPRLKSIDILPTAFPIISQFPTMPRITALVLHGEKNLLSPMNFPSLQAFTSFLASFPTLKILELKTAGWPAEASTAAIVAPLTLELDTLTIVASYRRRQLILDLASGALALRPRALAVKISDTGQPEVRDGVERYLRLLGSYLRTLRLVDGIHYGAIDISSNTALHTLALDDMILFTYQLDANRWSVYIFPALIRFLERFHPLSLETLIIGVRVHTVPDWTFGPVSVPFKSLVEVLEGLPYPAIKQIQVVGAWREHFRLGVVKAFATMVMNKLPASFLRRVRMVDPTD